MQRSLDCRTRSNAGRSARAPDRSGFHSVRGALHKNRLCSSPGQAGYQRRRTSPFSWRVGFRFELFETCSAFTHVTACTLAESPGATLYTEGFNRPASWLCRSSPPRLLRLLPAGATSCRVGISPTQDPRLFTAHNRRCSSEQSGPARASISAPTHSGQLVYRALPPMCRSAPGNGPGAVLYDGGDGREMRGHVETLGGGGSERAQFDLGVPASR